MTSEIPRREPGEIADPAMALVDALYEFAEQPESWLKALDAIERLPPQLEQSGPAAAQRLAAHAERAASLAEQLNRARQRTSMEPERWDALLISAEGDLRAITGDAEAILQPFLIGAPKVLERLSFRDGASAALQAAINAAREGRHGGLAHWMPCCEDTGERCFAIVIKRTAFPLTLSRAFGLNELGVEPLFAVAMLNTNSDAGDDHMRTGLGLTRAEWRLAQALKAGASVGDAAKRLSISVNTARTQVKSIYVKLGVERQSELVSRLNLSGRLGRSQAPVGDAPRFLMEAPTRRFITLDGGRRLAYREYGDARGKPVIVFHQWLAASMLTGPAMEAARDSKLRLVVFDRPGIGQSAPVRPYSIDSVARDAIALADHLEISQLQLMGIAPGAAFAIAVAALQPSRVEKIALAAPRLPTCGGPQRQQNFADHLIGLLQQPWIIRSFIVMMQSAMGERLAASMLKHVSSFSPSDRLEAARPATARAIMAQGFDAIETTTEGFIAELMLFAKPDQFERRVPSCPIAIWRGSEDGASITSMTGTFADLASAAVHIVPNEGVIFRADTYRAMFSWLRSDC